MQVRTKSNRLLDRCHACGGSVSLIHMRGTEKFVREIALSMPLVGSIEVWTLSPEMSRLLDMDGFAILRCHTCKATYTLHHTLNEGWEVEGEG